ncbi:MAG TPA: hypothetical protein VNH18_33680 [Bryobacteraceae bacterium]|nr:hypothetical protein [Bryobacteraceae bacterium]
MPEPSGKNAVRPATTANPTSTIPARPETRARINALAELEQRPAWKVVESAINLYFEQKSTRERHQVNAIAKPKLVSANPRG